MRGTYRFGDRSLIAHRSANDPHGQAATQLRTAPGLPPLITATARSQRAQRTVPLATIVLALALLCAATAFAEEPWSMDARAFHTDGFADGVTTQSLAGGGLTPDPLAPDAGTVAYIIHTKGRSWAAVVIYDPATRRYRHVCGLVGPFENASDIQTFDPLLRSVLATVRERGFPARLFDYTPDVKTMDLARYDDAVSPPTAMGQPTPQPIATMAAASPSPEPQRTAQQTLMLLAAGGTGLVLLALSGALLLHLFFRHREQMAVVRSATRTAPLVATPPTQAMAARPAQQTATRKARLTSRPTAVPAHPPAAKQQP